MLTAEATVATSRASRYLIQLCQHADQMRRIRHRPSRGRGDQTPPAVDRVDYSDTVGTVRFADGVLCVRASADTLTLRIEAADEAALRRLQNGIARRLHTIGRRDRLTLTWHQVDNPADLNEVSTHRSDSSPPPAARKAAWRGRLGMLALVAAGVLIVALHLGLGGAALAASAWTGWIGNIVLVGIVGAAVVLGAHVIAGRIAYRGGKAVHARWKQRRRPSPDTTPSAGPAQDNSANGEHT